jgi:hypothetical protein
LTHTSGGVVPTQKRNSNPRVFEEGIGGGQYQNNGAAAPVALQGRNSVASINSGGAGGYNDQNNGNLRSQTRGQGGVAQILSGTGDTGGNIDYRQSIAGNQQFVILDNSNDHYMPADQRRAAANL